jgi:hypothetical protein
MKNQKHRLNKHAARYARVPMGVEESYSNKQPGAVFSIYCGQGIKLSEHSG